MLQHLALGQKIKNLRIEKKLTQQEVAGDFITRNMLSKIESGTANPSLKTLELIAERLDKPITYFLENIEDESNFNPNEVNQLDIVFYNSSFHLKNKEYEKCIVYIQHNIDKFESTLSDASCGRILYNLGICYYNLDDYENAVVNLKKANLLLGNLQDYYYSANSNYILSVIYFSQKKYEEAEKFIRYSLSAFERSFINDIFLEIRIYYTLGYILRMQKKYNDALAPLLHSIRLSKEYNCHYNAGNTYMLLGNVYHFINDIDNAILYTRKAIELYDFSEMYDLKASSQKNLGNFLLNNQNYIEAIKCLSKALDYFQQVNNQVKSNTTKCDIFQCMVELNNIEESLQFYKAINLDMITTADKGNLFNNLGSIYLKNNIFDLSFKHLLLAEELLLEIKRYDYLSRTYKNLAELFSKTNNFKKAYEYSSLAVNTEKYKASASYNASLDLN
jgi:tetratricopeptide (TPR) repeat protein